MSGETRIQVTKRSNEGSERCLYCHEDFELEISVKITCPECHSPQHRACAMVHQRCSTLGCTATWAHLAGVGREKRSQKELSERGEPFVKAHARFTNDTTSHSRSLHRKLVAFNVSILVLVLIVFSIVALFSAEIYEYFNT